MIRIKNIILSLLIAGLIGNMLTPVYAMAKESPVSSEIENSWESEIAVPEEDAADVKEPKIKNKPKISKKNQKSIQKMCGYFSNYLLYDVTGQKIGKSISLNFKKQKNRKKVLAFMPALLHTKSLEDASKFVFGKKASGAITVYDVGWRDGDNKNIIKIKNIEAKGSKKYEAKFNLVYYNSLKHVKTKFANGVFYLEKTGKNDFVVTKLKVKNTKPIR